MRAPVVGVVSELRQFERRDNKGTAYQVVVDQKGEDQKVVISYDKPSGFKEGEQVSIMCRITATSRGLWCRPLREAAG